MLFLDEVSTAPPVVQAALLRVVLERTVGDLPLPDVVTVIVAANPPELAADGWDLAAPLANRFCHLDWSIDARQWAEGILGGFPLAVIPALDDDTLADVRSIARCAIGAFVMARPALLFRATGRPGRRRAGVAVAALVGDGRRSSSRPRKPRWRRTKSWRCSWPAQSARDPPRVPRVA